MSLSRTFEKVSLLPCQNPNIPLNQPVYSYLYQIMSLFLSVLDNRDLPTGVLALWLYSSRFIFMCWQCDTQWERGRALAQFGIEEGECWSQSLNCQQSHRHVRGHVFAHSVHAQLWPLVQVNELFSRLEMCVGSYDPEIIFPPRVITIKRTKSLTRKSHSYSSQIRTRVILSHKRQ